MPILNKEMMRATILAHYENPYHKGTPQNADEFIPIHLNSTGCIDDITLYLKVKDEVVLEGYFDGFGCTISIASTSILLEMIEGKTFPAALALITEYYKMMEGKEYDSEMLGEAIVFANTVRQPSRIKCATIGWGGAFEILTEFLDGGDHE